MAQLLVRNLEETVKRRLKQRAAKNGRSLEGEVREILRSVAGRPKKPAKPAKRMQGKGIGTELIEIFAGKVPPEFKIPRRDEPVRAVDFGE
ncbi:MAG TPA: hypothetical protein VGG48_06330 [Rhizomicrobium sp.]|jgi:plasmid stability protein